MNKRFVIFLHRRDQLVAFSSQVAAAAGRTHGFQLQEPQTFMLPYTSG